MVRGGSAVPLGKERGGCDRCGADVVWKSLRGTARAPASWLSSLQRLGMQMVADPDKEHHPKGCCAPSGLLCVGGGQVPFRIL